MDNATIKEKLQACFSTVFPDLDPSQIEFASLENTSGWDSIAHVTLLALISEEFGVEMDYKKYEKAISFSGFMTLIEEAVSNG